MWDKLIIDESLNPIYIEVWGICWDCCKNFACPVLFSLEKEDSYLVCNLAVSSTFKDNDMVGRFIIEEMNSLKIILEKSNPEIKLKYNLIYSEIKTSRQYLFESFQITSILENIKNDSLNKIDKVLN